MMWEDIYERDENEELDSPVMCEDCNEYFYEDDLTSITVEDEDDEYDILLCRDCKKERLDSQGI